MKKIDGDLFTVHGKSYKNPQANNRTKSFGYQVLGFGSGGGGPLYIVATGGSVSTSGDFKIHQFTSDGTFCVSCAGNSAGSNTADFLLVAGGGWIRRNGPWKWIWGWRRRRLPIKFFWMHT